MKKIPYLFTIWVDCPIYPPFLIYDIPLINEDYPGKNGTWNFQVTVTANNNRTEQNWLPRIDMIVIYTGRMDINNGNVSQIVGIEPGAAISGRLLKEVSGLVSGLLGSEESSGQTGKTGTAGDSKSNILRRS